MGRVVRTLVQGHCPIYEGQATRNIEWRRRILHLESKCVMVSVGVGVIVNCADFLKLSIESLELACICPDDQNICFESPFPNM